jgi:hypothetical protein
MHPKSSVLEDILSKTGDDEHFEFGGVPGRKPGVKAPPKPTGKGSARNLQAWRAIEDLKDNQRLDSKLKEIYDEK